MKASLIRRAFLDFFAARGHTVEPSASLVPANDRSLLFTNAGMAPFKDVFLGRETREDTRVTSSQRCVRAGGKHNDLDNVGYTARHHTFFEMLGNFSFGDYFKEEAMAYAWSFITEVLGLPKEKLWVTVFREDDEAADIWAKQIGVPLERIVRCDEKDNFWSMGDVGPCGPCSEIFYDHGPEVRGGPPGSPEADGDRYIEIWNLVFMQFDRQPDGQLLPLPKPCVDTGMGLERLSAVLQGVHSNYQTDLFVPMLQAFADRLSRPLSFEPSFCVLADHLRSVSFLLHDGVVPGPDGRGYVLRRIMRRALRHGYSLGFSLPFFFEHVPVLASVMQEAYPHFALDQQRIADAIRQEELLFKETLATGMKIFEIEAQKLASDAMLSGDVAFRLYDTHGFPLDLTLDLARERNLRVDEEGFDRALEAQRLQSRAHSAFRSEGRSETLEMSTLFEGYTHEQASGHVLFLSDPEGKALASISEGQSGLVVLDRTPFYAESGGQIGDTGVLRHDSKGFFEVVDTQKSGEAIVHQGLWHGEPLFIGDALRAEVDAKRRQAIARHHSATHLLHAALRAILGPSVQQMGSWVGPSRLRFDFSYPQALSLEDKQAIERWVMEAVVANLAVQTHLCHRSEAERRGAIALFGEKYGEQVRVLSMGDLSIELCGGTHVAATGDIGLFEILSESAVASGVRRIEAVAGLEAVELRHQRARDDDRQARALGFSVSEWGTRLAALQRDYSEQQKAHKSLWNLYLHSKAEALRHHSKPLPKGLAWVSDRLENVPPDVARMYVDRLREEPKLLVVVAVVSDKLQVLVGLGSEVRKHLRAGDLARWMGERCGGQGGGRDDFAQCGGSDARQFSPALEGLMEHVRQLLERD